MKTSPFKYQIISTQTWNNNKIQLISEHKTLKQAEKMLDNCQKDKKSENTYHIQTL